MDNQDDSSQTMRAGSLSPTSTISQPALDLSRLPSIAIFTAHLKDEEERTLKETLRQYDAPLTTDVSRAKIFIGKVGTKRRAEFELRSRKLVVEEAVAPKRPASPLKVDIRSSKRRRIGGVSSRAGPTNDGDSTTEDEAVDDSETEDEAPNGTHYTPLSSPTRSEKDMHTASTFENTSKDDIIWVIKFDWVEACVTAGHLLPLGDSLVYKGKVSERPKSANPKSIKDIFSSDAVGYTTASRARCFGPRQV
jgi:DNA polymerase IV